MLITEKGGGGVADTLSKGNLGMLGSCKMKSMGNGAFLWNGVRG